MFRVEAAATMGAMRTCTASAPRVRRAPFIGPVPPAVLAVVMTMVAAMVGAWPSRAAATATAVLGTRYRPAVTSARGVVASDHPLASAAGIAILNDGGNAMDAAVATVFAVGVVRPEMCGIGGGGFLVYRGADGVTAALDFREKSPGRGYTFTRGLFDADSQATFGTGHNVIGVPGTVAGMAAAAERFGTRPLAALLQRAIVLADEGFPVSPTTAAHMSGTGNRMRLFPESARVYLKADQRPYEAGEHLELDDYANSLRLIARDGRDAFYRGAIAEAIVKDIQRLSPYPGDRGSMTLADLRDYQAVWRDPLIGTYRNHRVIAMPPPTSGGIATIEALNILEGFDLAAFGQHSAHHLHVLAEAQKIAWADRNRYVADPAFVDIPAALTSKDYAARRRAEIDMRQARDYGPAAPESASHTTHVSVIDAEGNAVAVTCSIEQPFGSAVVAPGTGFLLNNQLTDFSEPGSANEPAPGKRPRSSTSPTIVVHRGRPVLVVGGAGGATIIMGAVQAVSNVADFHLDVAGALDAARIDARAYGSALAIEDARIAPEVMANLESRSHQLQRLGEYAAVPIMNAAGIVPSTNQRQAATDPRGDPAERGAAGQ